MNSASGLPAQAGDVEAVDAGEVGGLQRQVKRQRSQIALGRDPLGLGADLGGGDRRAREVGLGGQEGRDLALALLGLQRAGAVDEQRRPARTRVAAWPASRRCSSAMRADVLGRASGAGCRDGGGSCPWPCRARRARPRRRCAPGDQVAASASTTSAASCSRCRFSRRRSRRAADTSTAVTWAPAAASAAVLPPGAAHRSATAVPGHVAGERAPPVRRPRPAPTRRPRRSRAGPRCGRARPGGSSRSAAGGRRAARPRLRVGVARFSADVEGRLAADSPRRCGARCPAP